jgi:predicted metalloprotease
MRWTPGGVSGNIEDRRGSSGMGFGGGGIRLGLGGFILIAILSLIFKTDFFSLLGGGGGRRQRRSARHDAEPPAERSQGAARSAVCQLRAR